MRDIRYCNTYYAILLSLASFVVRGASLPVSAADNLNFSGTLVTEPCDLDPTTTDLIVDFDEVIKKGLYLHNRTTPEKFTINLIDCDTSLGKQVIMTFKGSESSVLPGMLATAGDASGIAIGIETIEGNPLPINQPLQSIELVEGTNPLSFQAWVEGEPDAIKNQTIVSGMFSAVATFEMDYP